MAIYFHDKEETAGIKNKNLLKTWLRNIIFQEGYKPGQINVIFSSDEFLLELNRTYLSRDYITDIITFDYTENETVNGDLFVSIPRVKENAVIFNDSYGVELKRVIVHGVLHMMGYDDGDETLKLKMRDIEDKYLEYSPNL